MPLKLTILLNIEINHLIDRLAKRMGTSKRNVISLALSNILKSNITEKNIEEIKENIHGLSHSTNITVNPSFKGRLEQLNRFGLSKRKFFGYLICDYFYKYYSEFLGDDIIKEDSGDYEIEKDYVQITIDKTIKEKITTYCDDNAIAVNSLFAHYIMNKQLNVGNFSSTDKELMNLAFSVGVRKRLGDQAEAKNMSYRYYLNLIAAQICKDLGI